jgi:hypothetical protein
VKDKDKQAFQAKVNYLQKEVQRLKQVNEDCQKDKEGYAYNLDQFRKDAEILLAEKRDVESLFPDFHFRFSDKATLKAKVRWLCERVQEAINFFEKVEMGQKPSVPKIQQPEPEAVVAQSEAPKEVEEEAYFEEPEMNVDVDQIL